MVAIALHVAHGQFGLGGQALNSLFYDWLYDAIVLGAAVSCLARAWLIREERLPWLLLGIGLGFDAAGEIYYSLAFGDTGNPPIPSLADAFYLLYYPAVSAGLLLLVKHRIGEFRTYAWMDGAIAGIASAAVIAALAFESIFNGARHGSTASIVTTLAYPIGDMMLLGTAVGMVALTGWRPGRAWLFLATGLVLSAIADTGYAYVSANGTYAVGGLLDSMWLAAAWFTACAPWQPPAVATARRPDSTRMLLIPGLFALVALGVLLYGGFDHVGALALVLAGAALLLMVVRAALIFADNVRLLRHSQHEALTDALTGLGNRRMMQAALERVLARGAEAEPAVFVMFDLDGFKAYNDRFGHLAGDTMLTLLGDRLRTAINTAGDAYRPGGDEFCLIITEDLAKTDVWIAAALTALSADGDGFTVCASYGSVTIPSDASTPSEVLRLADDRMYERKSGRRSSASQQTHDALLGLLRERQPALVDHLHEVGRLALGVGRKLAMDAEQLDELRRAAELHDIGKVAIPDAIIHKPGRLNEHEWEFMRRHTLIGERILAAAPALSPVARLVRSTHERWDGTGYPDGLAGEQIPLGARIIVVCDAFDAMTSERPYGSATSPDDAIAELRRGAGTQFDPAVVDAFVVTRKADRDNQANGSAAPDRDNQANGRSAPDRRAPSLRSIP